MSHPAAGAHRRLPPGWRGVGVAIILGSVAALGQAPVGAWPFTILALAVALALWPIAPWRRGFALGWALGLGYFALSLHWIVQPFLVDVARHGWMAPFALVLMAGGMALFWGVAGAIASWIGPTRLALPVTLIAAEMLRSHILTGFPWALLGHVWIDTPIAQAAAWVGPHGLTLLTIGFAAGMAAAGLRLWVLGPIGVLLLAWIGLSPGPATNPDPDAPLVRIIQPNAAQDQKWQPGMARLFFERQLDQTRSNPDGPRPDLVVWPETSVPWLLEQADLALDDVARAAGDAPVILGVQRRDGRRYYNSLAVIGPNGDPTAIYDKHHIVPFGEYMPLGELAARFGIHGLAASEGGGYSRGSGPALVDVPGVGLALPLICYEGIFAEEVNAPSERPRLLVLITNDAWFGDWAGPAQHLAQARLRAIEQGLPLVRAANTGISAMIDPQGRIVADLALNTQGVIDAPLPDARPPTLYSRAGDWPAGLLLLGLLAALVGRRRLD